MYCRYCGKQISDEAIMCPDCGTPTQNMEKTTAAKEVKPQEVEAPVTSASQLSVVGFVLALISFVSSMIFGSYLFAEAYANGYIIGCGSIMPAFAGLSIGIYRVKLERGGKKAFAIISIVLSGIALFYLFLAFCVFGAAY